MNGLFNVLISFYVELLPPPPNNNVGKELLFTLVKLLKDLPPQSLGVAKRLSVLGESCLEKGREFLAWALSVGSNLDRDSKSLVLELLFLFCLQEGESELFVVFFSTHVLYNEYSLQFAVVSMV